MPQLVEVRVPDIGDFKDIPIIELLAKAGDTVQVEDALMTLESDKATLDVPSPVAGVIQEMKVKLGDKVSTGTLVATVMVSEAAPATVEQAAKVGLGETATKTVTAPSASATTAPAAPAPGAATITSTFAGKADIVCDMLVLGAGPGGYSAAFRAADLGLKTVLVERYSTLGGVCLNVGCIPSKALLHVAQVMDEAAHASALGVEFAPPKVDIGRLRAHKAGVVSKLTTGLAGMAKARKVDVVRGVGRFLDAFHLEVATTTGSGQETTGETRVIQFRQCIIAAGSAAIHLPFLPDDKRIVDSTGALELPFTPKKML
ncbi:MAG: FAD-dependent oxidoreductase, partial [Rugosibacter sp.]|nr:FAD-dependent oxidoreductase [Rugosibacter sp.]